MSAKTTPAPQKTPATTKQNPPVKTFRLGRIKAAIWAQESDERTFYNVTFARTYVDDQKQFHDADSFGRDDLPLVAKLADQAHTFIFERLAEVKADDER
jgi:hypothetical protein